MTIKYTELRCEKIRGGKHALWHARSKTAYGSVGMITGAGNTADNAIKDFQKQYRNLSKIVWQ